MSVYDQGRVFLKEYKLKKKKLVGAHGHCSFVHNILWTLKYKMTRNTAILLYTGYMLTLFETYSRKMAEMS